MADAFIPDLAPGDLVVHRDHGFARFLGIETLDERGPRQDFLVLAFAGDSRLFVPATRIGLVHRQPVGSGRSPALSRIGGRAWKRRLDAAGRATDALAASLLAARAERSVASAPALTPDPARLRAFIDAFPHRATEDQEAADAAIAADLARSQPMDRLLCGDVGFGKTEIAMRAVYRAVASGRQAVVLAPTTLLAEQHLASFRRRFAGTGARIEAIDGARPDAERDAVLARAAAGEVEVLIGTHALLDDRLRLPAAGLLVVDEEHRFGVEQKERLKRLRTGVHVLAMTATPIPRTLQSALAGLQALSVMNQAPAERSPVRTVVGPWDAGTLRQALRDELARGGQVYAVHPRVQGLARLLARLRRLAPQATFGVVHGQLPSGEAEQALRAFAAGSTSILVATTIVANGLDVPNANLLIVESSQRLGLADLHQLRGRVGRSDLDATAFFLTPPSERLPEAARERLRALAAHAELGAGLALAQRDLDLRGAGDLLGPEQSGHIHAVGIELYLELLAGAVARVRGEPAPSPAAEVDLGVEAFIPAEHWPDAGERLAIHRALDRCADEDAIAAVRRALEARHAPLPRPLERLLRLRALAIRAGGAGVARASRRADGFTLDQRAVLAEGVDDDGLLAAVAEALTTPAA